MRSVFRVALLVFLCIPVSLLAESAGSVHGTVVGPDNRPMPGVLVTLRNDVTGFHQDNATAADGSYAFFNVPYNPYVIHVDVQGFAPVARSIDVRTPVPVMAPIKLAVAQLTESISVTAEQPAAALETDTSMTHIDIDKSYIAKAPAAVASRAMEQIVTSTPGFAKDENGRFHFQGAHSQGEYVIDGQTISDQTGVTFSNSIDPGIAQGIEVIYGNVPAEFGEKIGAVINLTTKSGLGAGAPKTDAYIGASNFATLEGGASVGGGSQTFGYFVSVDGSKSNRFLDPVNFDNLHNHGNTERGFIRLDRNSDQKNAVRLDILVGATNRDVTNTYTQQASGQNQRVRTSDENLNFGWTSIFSDSSLLELIGFGRFSKFRLDPSPGDTPVTAISNRSLNNYGLAPSFSWTNSNHDIKAGLNLKRYPIHELFEFGLTDPTLNDPMSGGYNPNLAPYDLTRGGHLFVLDGSRTGSYYAAYVQDNVKWRGLTADLGVRYDNNNLPLKDTAVEPRLGVAYYLERTKTVLRASYNKVLYTPEFENILFSSSPEAASLAPPVLQQSRELGGGQILVHSERQNAYDFGVQQGIGSRLRLDADYWMRRSRFTGDQDQFQSTGIVFPLAFTSGHLNGWNARLDLSRIMGFRGFFSIGHVHAEYIPPQAGGLFLDPSALDTLTGDPFLIDHDEKLAAQGSLLYNIGHTGYWIGTNVRYDSGLVCGAAPTDLVSDPDNSFAIPYISVHSNAGLDPNRIRARTIVDFSVGADLQKYRIPLGVQADLLNAANKKGLYNILSTFGGTHVIPPRTLAVRVRYTY